MSDKSHIHPLEDFLARLQRLEGHFLGRSMRFRDGASGAFDPMALLSYAALKRTLLLIDGFARMVEERNLVCAGALLRVQLDTALRFHAAFLVDDQQRFAEAILKGVKVSALRDREDQKLTDRFLRDSAAQEFPWIVDVYEHASGFVHFSEKHLLADQSAVATKPSSELVLVNISSFDDVSDLALGEAADAFARAAELVDVYTTRWIEQDKS